MKMLILRSFSVDCFPVGCIAENGDHWLMRGADGLPYGPVTIIKCQGETLWLGTDRGAIKKDKSWHYYNGKRWLPDNTVNDILPLWMNTQYGLRLLLESARFSRLK